MQLVEHHLAQIAQQVGGQPRIEIIAAQPNDRDHDRPDGEARDNADQQGVVAEDQAAIDDEFEGIGQQRIEAELSGDPEGGKANLHRHQPAKCGSGNS